jgi:hypothetical protein
MSVINKGFRGRLTRFFGGSQLDNHLIANNNRIIELEQSVARKSSLSSQILDLIDMQQKTQTLINPISYRQTYSTSGGEVITFPPEAYDFFINNMLGNSTSRPMLQARKQELTRNGLELVSVFASKCPACEIDYDQIMEECDNCGNTEEDIAFILPDEKEKEFAESWIEEDFKVNNNRQNLFDLIEMTLEFTDIVDDGWWVIENEYILNKGYIMATTPQELWVIHPANMAWSVDKFNKIGKYEWTCVEHRGHIAKEPGTFCDVDGCGNILYPVIAVRYHPGTQTIIQRYITNEVLHGSLHRPSALNGYPPAITLQYELSLTTNQMKYMSDYYDDVNYHKTPGYLLLPTTKSWEDVWKETKRMRKELQMDPFAIGVLPYSPDGTAKPEFVRFDTTPREMEFIPTRDEARGRMSAFYGVSPIMQADVSAGGGLNNEGLQFTVTNRAVSKAQQYINRNFLTPISNLLNLTDWIIRLAPNEEQDKVAELDYKIKVAGYAEQMLRLGYDNKLDSNHDLQIIAKKDMPEDDPYKALFEEENAAGYQIMNEDVPALEEGSETSDQPKSSDGLQGAPKTPDVALKKMKEPYDFLETYPDWEWKDDYELVEFRIIHLSEIKSHPDFEIKEEDIENGSPRVRAGTIIYYLSEATEMDPLIMDINYNLLDGNHRKYVLDKRKQEMVTAAIVKPKTKILEIVYEDELQMKAQLRAPKGGVTIQGKFYAGGKFIPKEVLENMSTEEKQAVEQGKDAGSVDSVADDKKKPKKLLPDYRRDVKQDMRGQIKETRVEIAIKDKKVKQINKDIKTKVKQANKLRNDPDRWNNDEISDQIVALRTELYDMDYEVLDIETEINSLKRDIEVYQDRRRYPDYDIADQYDVLGTQMKEAKTIANNKDFYENRVEFEKKEIATYERVIKNKSWVEIDPDFAELTDEEGLETFSELLAISVNNLKDYEDKLSKYDESKKFVDENSERLKVLKRGKIRKDGELWKYYKHNKMKEYEKKTELRRMVDENDTKAIKKLFDGEVEWARERLNIGKYRMPEIILEFDPPGINARSFGYSDFAGRTIALNMELFKKDPTSIQETIRHEIAHFMDHMGTAPDYWTMHREYESLEWHSFEATLIADKMNEYSKQFTREWFESNKLKHFTEGHGSKWQDTMQVLFGLKPRHRYHGGAGYPVEV